MSKFTRFLKLLMKDPVADAAETFNIQTMLNENWEKIDAEVVARSPFIVTYGDEDWDTFDAAVAAYEAGRPVILHRWSNDGTKLHQSSLSMTDYTNAADVLIFREPMEAGNSTNCRFIRNNPDGYVYWTMESKFPTPAEHTQAASTITAGTFAGRVVAQNSAMSSLTVAQVRNVYISSTDLTAGSSSLTTGSIRHVYE